ncbi:MAG: hypothetical protein ACT4O3_09885 [Elusimicrobiota bacterium]|jgi:hypothetical protein
MDALNDDALERRLAEQAILGQSLMDKRERIEELEREVRYLRDTLNTVLAAPRPAPVPAPAPHPRRGAPVPVRWTVAK